MCRRDIINGALSIDFHEFHFVVGDLFLPSMVGAISSDHSMIRWFQCNGNERQMHSKIHSIKFQFNCLLHIFCIDKKYIAKKNTQKFTYITDLDRGTSIQSIDIRSYESRFNISKGRCENFAGQLLNANILDFAVRKKKWFNSNLYLQRTTN